MFFIYAQYRQRHPDLGVVTFGTANDMIIGTQQKVKPFFDYGFSVAPRYANDGKRKFRTVSRGQLLQGYQSVGNN